MNCTPTRVPRLVGESSFAWAWGGSAETETCSGRGRCVADACVCEEPWTDVGDFAPAAAWACDVQASAVRVVWAVAAAAAGPAVVVAVGYVKWAWERRAERVDRVLATLCLVVASISLTLSVLKALFPTTRAIGTDPVVSVLISAQFSAFASLVDVYIYAFVVKNVRIVAARVRMPKDAIPTTTRRRLALLWCYQQPAAILMTATLGATNDPLAMFGLTSAAFFIIVTSNAVGVGLLSFAMGTVMRETRRALGWGTSSEPAAPLALAAPVATSSSPPNSPISSPNGPAARALLAYLARLTFFVRLAHVAQWLVVFPALLIVVWPLLQRQTTFVTAAFCIATDAVLAVAPFTLAPDLVSVFRVWRREPSRAPTQKSNDANDHDHDYDAAFRPAVGESPLGSSVASRGRWGPRLAPHSLGSSAMLQTSVAETTHPGA